MFGEPVYSKEELKEIAAKEKQAKKELEDARKNLKKDLGKVLNMYLTKASSDEIEEEGSELENKSQDTEETSEEEESDDDE